ncbi:MAG: dihydropteroate synthase [Deltaproteobacteria bacterium]|nr:dihydropteroate synthase [Candidatus Tharpellaceae bacterium]
MELIAENINIVDPLVAPALADLDAEPIIRLIKAAVHQGINTFDLNVGSHTHKAPRLMAFLLEKVWLSLASRQQRSVIVNALSLEAKKWDQILPLLQEYEQSQVVLLLMTPQVPRSSDERLVAALEGCERLIQAGISLDRLIIDPVVVPLGWGDGHLHSGEILKFLHLLPEALSQPVKTMVGLSNITTRSTGRPVRQDVEVVFLSMLAALGLDYAMVNVRHQSLIRTAQLIKSLQGKEIFSPASLEESPL